MVFENESILLSVRLSNQKLYAIVVVQVPLPVMLCCSLTRKPGATQGLDIKMTVKSGRRLRARCDCVWSARNSNEHRVRLQEMSCREDGFN